MPNAEDFLADIKEPQSAEDFLTDTKKPQSESIDKNMVQNSLKEKIMSLLKSPSAQAGLSIQEKLEELTSPPRLIRKGLESIPIPGMLKAKEVLQESVGDLAGTLGEKGLPPRISAGLTLPAAILGDIATPTNVAELGDVLIGLKAPSLRGPKAPFTFPSRQPLNLSFKPKGSGMLKKLEEEMQRPSVHPIEEVEAVIKKIPPVEEVITPTKRFSSIEDFEPPSIGKLKFDWLTEPRPSPKIIADKIRERFNLLPKKSPSIGDAPKLSSQLIVEEEQIGNIQKYIDDFSLRSFGPLNSKSVLVKTGKDTSVRSTKDVIENMHKFKIIPRGEITSIFGMDPLRIADTYDPSGTLLRHYVYPMFDAELVTRKQTVRVINDLNKEINIKPGSKEDFLIGDVIEKRVDITDVIKNILHAEKVLSSFYKTAIEELNKAEKRLGLPLTKTRQDYIPHIKEITLGQQIYGIEDYSKMQARLRTPTKAREEFFQKKRSGAEFIMKSPLDAVKDYISAFSRFINNAPLIEKMRNDARAFRTGDLKDFLRNPARRPISTANFLDNLADGLSGKIHPSDIAWERGMPTFTVGDKEYSIARGIDAYSKRAVESFILLNPSTMAIQYTSLVPAFAKLPAIHGLKLITKHLFLAANPSVQEIASRISRTVAAAGTETNFTEMAKGIKNIKKTDIPRYIGQEMLSYFDRHTKTAVFNAFLEYFSKQPGLNITKAIELADKSTAKTQGLTLRSNRPDILRSRRSQTLFPLQKYTYNLFNFLKKDLLDSHFLDPPLAKNSIKGRAPDVVKMIVGTTGAWAFYKMFLDRNK